jgi:predicted Mrr-cat superfamily restriction endonuclease
METNNPLWIIRCSPCKGSCSTCERDSISVSWSPLRNLRQIKNARQAFKKACLKANPDLTPRQAGWRAAELYNFVYGMKVGDYVVCLPGLAGPVRVGRVIGHYKYIYVKRMQPHTREVKWENQLREVETLPPRVRRTLRAGRPLYKPQKYGSEIRDALLP